MHLDLAFLRPDLGRTTAVELKYLTRLWSGTVGGERYELKNQGAQDIHAYGVVKDVVRVEKFIAGTAGADGGVIVLGNDSSYWRPAKVNDISNAAAFRVSEGVVLTGPRAWGPNTGAGTMKTRELRLEVTGQYEMRWSDYSTLPGGGQCAMLRTHRSRRSGGVVTSVNAVLDRLARWSPCTPWDEAVRIAPPEPGVYLMQVAGKVVYVGHAGERVRAASQVFADRWRSTSRARARSADFGRAR